MKPYHILLIILLFLTPFVLMRDVFPLFRFSMFAEKPKYSSQMESFEVKVKVGDRVYVYNPNEYGLTFSHFNSLKRKYFYTNNVVFFLKNLPLGSIENKGDVTLEFWRYLNRDSIKVEVYER